LGRLQDATCLTPADRDVARGQEHARRTEACSVFIKVVVVQPALGEALEHPAWRVRARTADRIRTEQLAARNAADETARPDADLHTGPGLQGSLGHSTNRVGRERGMVFDVTKGLG
jgi:hypothetical protein